MADEIRRTRQTLLDGPLRSEVEARLDTLMPALARHFAMDLTGREGTSFLMYDAGGFFRPHRDREARDTRRRVSTVLFLNRHADPPGPMEYCGGRLILYGLIPDAPDIGFPVEPEPGLLVAFDATTLHEVTPVHQGRRMTAVDWFF